MSTVDKIRIVSKYHWGTFVWAYIHTITVCDKSEGNEYDFNCTKNNLINVADIIPCEECRREYQEWLKDLKKITFSDLEKDKMVLFKWTFNLHNYVNRKLRKKEFTYPQAIDKWVKLV